MELQHIIIISPVYNDWECVEYLQNDLQLSINPSEYTYELILVNDGSQNGLPASLLKKNVIVIDLVRNLGHQKAIATGLAYVAAEKKCDWIIVMDADGEDRPQDIQTLLDATGNQQDMIWFAQRRKRQENSMFKFLYFFYKIAFKSLTGYLITFGNFVLIPFEKAQRLVYVSEIWNHFPGGIMRSKIPYGSVPIDRGTRYRGQSKMNMVALIQHGLSSITVNMDIVAVRLLIFSFTLIIITFLILSVLFGIKLFSNLAIPGWTSSIGIGLAIILLLAFFFSLLLTFTILNGRVQKTFIPAVDYKTFIYKITTSSNQI
ncbi:MAG TPA: glycosyltransferase [Saprospiraceae bacterium]|nr:glycosyltransferase [Saprospiraceae bacterium]HQW55550.1 glycosyltransferase [Saprospiraceae bacterium]